MSLFDDWQEIISRDLNWNNGQGNRSWSERTLDPLGLYDYATQGKPLLTDRSEDVKNVASYVGEKITEAAQDKEGWTDDAVRMGLGGLKNVGQAFQTLDEAGQDTSNLFSNPANQAAFLVGNAVRLTNFAGEKGADAAGWLAKKTGVVDEDAARLLGMLGSDYLLTMGAGAAAKGLAKGAKAAYRGSGVGALVDTARGQGMAVHAGTGLIKDGKALKHSKQFINKWGDDADAAAEFLDKGFAHIAAGNKNLEGVGRWTSSSGLEYKLRPVRNLKSIDPVNRKGLKFAPTANMEMYRKLRAAREAIPEDDIADFIYKLGYGKKDVDNYIKYVRSGNNQLKKQVAEINKRAGGEMIVSFGHQKALAKGGINTPKNVRVEDYIINVSKKHKGDLPDEVLRAMDVPFNWREDVLKFLDPDVGDFFPKGSRNEKTLQRLVQQIKSKDPLMTFEEAVNDALQEMLRPNTTKAKAIVKSKSKKLQIKDKPKPKPTQEIDPFDPRLVSRKSETVDLKTGQIRRTEDMTDFVKRMYEKEKIEAAARELKRQQGRMIDVTPRAPTRGPTIDLNDILNNRL